MMAFRVMVLAMVLYMLTIESTANNRRCDDGCKVSTGGLSCQTCKRGCYGKRCSQRCRHCDSAGCDRETGRCHRCRRGRYGEACHQRCPLCPLNTHCDRLNGTCIKTYQVLGIFGALCMSSNKCPPKCKRPMCLTSDGHCHPGCERGLKGVFCKGRCSSNCLCNTCHNNGVCRHGCTSGFYGQRCEKKCSTRVIAECDRLTGCSSTCREGLCHPDNGSCVHGCIQGWRGSYCSERYFELNCSGGHCDDGGAGGGHEDGKLSRILIILGVVNIIATVMGSIAACCTRKDFRRMVFLKMRKKQVEAAYMKTESPVYLGTAPKEVKLK
ncbi:multiple epidermal growth factor-like domains protein 10 [Haliotis asinina]|uniref:multiple epidermal growth factor-like domains protein 10 n=1 Tax=Haliotis asinina TaxID=109174 RepID=UPI0035323AD8